MSTTNILDLNNRIDALEKFAHNVEPIQQQIDELKAWTDSGTKDASGNPIILTDGAAFKAEGLVVTLEPKQSGSGTPSPENVRPITGYTECAVDRDSRNLYAEGNQSFTGIKEVNLSLKAGTYTISALTTTTATNRPTIIFFNGATDIGRVFLPIGTRTSATITLTQDVTSVKFQAGETTATAAGKDATFTDIQLEEGNTATPYIPYSHYNATLTFGQTVYGGSVDFKTGKVTVTHASIASYNGETISEPWLSSIDEYVSGTTPTTGAQVVYPLTTPTQLTLTPAELELLKGYNYITTNGTTIELTYQPDNLKADIMLTVSQLYGSKISIFDGILAGGDTGQVLTKTSDDNYDATWETLPATRTTTRKSEK